MLARLWRSRRLVVPAVRALPSRTLTSLTRRPALNVTVSKKVRPLSPIASALQTAHAAHTATAQTQNREYKVNCGDIKTGHIIEIDNKLYLVTGLQIAQSAMRKSSLTFELKDLKTGAKSPHRVKGSDKIERIEIERKHFTFLYREGSILYLMTPDTFEQIEVDATTLTSEAKDYMYLRDNTNCAIEMNGEKMVKLVPPHTAIVQVKRCGSMGGEGLKPADLDNGRTIKVSPHIATGDWIKVNVEDESFVEKVPAPSDK